jgi:tripartite-type tricarboxylate transporter receptor subunit TctC
MNLLTALFGVLALSFAAPLFAQDSYPSKPIRIVTPFPAGGSVDILSRLVASKLTETWKVPVLVEARPGANTIIAAEHVAKSPADGYTVLACIDSTLTMNQFLYAKLPYDPVRDFAPITVATTQPLLLAVNPGIGVNNVPELIELAKAKPGQLSFAYGVVFNQLAGEVFASSANVNMLGVPYKGGTLAMNDLMSGAVQVIFVALSSTLGNIKSGKIKPLAVTSAKRHSAVPDIPAIAETLPGYEMLSWTGFVAPAGVSKDTIARLHQEFARILNLPEVKDKLAAIGQDVVAGTPEEFAQLIRSETVKFERLIKAAKITIQ